MDLYILDKNFNILKIVSVFTSLVWNRKYFETGSFSLKIEGDNFFNDYNERKAKYIYNKNFKELAVIQSLKNQSDSKGKTTNISGKFMETILSDKVIRTTENYYDYSVNIARALIQNHITDYVLNIIIDNSVDLSEMSKIQVSFTGETIEEAIRKMFENDGISFNIVYDYLENKLNLNIWKGLDRTDTQNVNTWAIFSESNETILDSTYTYNDSKYKNVAIVAGEGEGANRVIVEVDLSESGEKKKELYVDARDLQQGDLTLAQYKNALRTRGIEKLLENKLVEKVDFSADTKSTLIYKTDYDLGDIVTYKEDNGYINKRITGITEAYEGENEKLDIIFGDDYVLKGVFK